MIDHTGIGVTDVARAAVFYRAVRPCVSLKLSPVMLTMSEWWRMRSSIATLSTPSPAKALSCRSLTNLILLPDRKHTRRLKNRLFNSLSGLRR